MADTTSTPAAAKRVRFDDSVNHGLEQPAQPIDTSSSSSSSATATNPISAEPWCSANDAIRLHVVRTAADISPDESAASEPARKRGFRPDFTHQLFDEERLEGYEEGDVTIQLLHTASSLHWLVKVHTSDNDATRMADIMSRLSRALPSARYCTTDEASFEGQLEGRRRDFKPPGERVFEYKRGVTTFSVYRATGEDPGAGEYHARAQCLAPWFIEAADPIDLTDDRWEVFYLFEEETKREVLGEKWRPAALAGYFTVFGFRNPVKGVSLRICQALILPHFQRQGHGQALLAYLYELARSRESVFEITVEDPAPGFEKVRNLVDARTLQDLGVFPADLLSPGVFKRPSKDAIQAAHKAVKLTVAQTEIGFDILKARDLQTAKRSRASVEEASLIGRGALLKGEETPFNGKGTSFGAAGTSSKENGIPLKENGTPVKGEGAPLKENGTPFKGEGSPLKENGTPAPGTVTVKAGPEAAAAAAVSSDADTICEEKRKQYRLMVKRRLLKRYGEELSTDAPTRKRQLEELYRDLEPGFLSLGAKMLEKDNSRGKNATS